MAVKLGEKARDQASGFAGTVTGTAQYFKGRNRALVQPQCRPGGDFVKPRWFDDDRLIIIIDDDVDREVICQTVYSGAGCDGQRGTKRSHLDTALGRFVRSYGSDKLAKALGVDPRTVRYWVSGTVSPQPQLARRLLEIARECGTELTAEDIARRVGTANRC